MNDFLFILAAYLLANLPYKRKIFVRMPPVFGWLIGMWFGLWGAVLLISSTGRWWVGIPLWSLTVFTAVSVLWFRQRGRSTGESGSTANHPISLTLDMPHIAFAKYMEVLFQQCSFIYLTSRMFLGVSDVRALLLFGTFVASVHLFNMFFMSLRLTLLYTVLSFPMAILFAVLIINGQIFITASIHLAYYMVERRILLSKK